MKKKIWKYSLYILLVLFAFNGIIHTLQINVPDLGAFYLILFTLFFLSCMLLYEYQKVYWYSKRMKSELSDITGDNERAYSYTNQQGLTAFYMDASDVIRAIEEERDLLTPNLIKVLKDKYRNSPKISFYLKQKIRAL